MNKMAFTNNLKAKSSTITKYWLINQRDSQERIFTLHDLSITRHLVWEKDKWDQILQISNLCILKKGLA